MPFAEETGRVAGVMEPLGNRHLLERKMVEVRRRQQLAYSATAEPVGRVGTGRVSTSKDATPGRRAHWAGRVCVGEAGSQRREPIDVRRLVEATAVHSDVGPAKIVDQNEHEVRKRGGATSILQRLDGGPGRQNAAEQEEGQGCVRRLHEGHSTRRRKQ